MTKYLKRFQIALAVCVATLTSLTSHAASGEMGTGVPSFGTYTQASAPGVTYVWLLSSASIGFPAGCSFISLTKATMGDDYKIAIATLLLAKSTNKSVRFYAHTDRDGGCRVDYVQLL